MVDLTQMRSFVEVAERGTVAAAAAALGFTPPAVSQHLGKLERTLNVALFDRLGGKLSLSEAGEALVPIARDLLEIAGKVQEVVHEPPARPRVVIAGFASAIAALVTPRLYALDAVASIHVVEAEDGPALRELRLGHVDLAIVQRYPGDRTDRDPRLRYTDLHTDDLRLVLPPTFAAGTRLTELDELPWLVNGSGTRCEAATRQILRAAGIQPVVAGDVADNQLLLDLVAAGHGATIIPDLVLADRRANVTISKHALGIARTIIAVTRQTASPATRAALDLLVAGRHRGTRTRGTRGSVRG